MYRGYNHDPLPDFLSHNQVISKEEAYVLGLFYADGTVSNVTRQKHVRIALKNTDKEVLQKVNKYLNFNEAERLYKSEKKPEGTMMAILETGIVEWVDRFVILGVIPNKTYSISTFVFDNVPDKFKWDFIRGYFDGNGSISVTKREKKGRKYSYDFHIGSHNKPLVEVMLKFITTEMPNNSKITYNYPNYYIRFTSRPKLLFIRDKFYSNCGNLFMKRKKEEFDKIPTQYFSNFNKLNYPNSIKYDKRSKKYLSVLKINGKRKQVGRSYTIKEAVEKYNAGALKYGLPTIEYKGEHYYVEEYEQYLASSQVDA